MIGFIRLALIACIVWVGSAQAAPSISGTSGTWSHGGSVTINGSAFGTKATAAPFRWDNAETGTNITDLWSGKLPDCSTDHRFDADYRTTQRGISQAHARSYKYIAGAHASTTNNDANCGYDVGIWRYLNITSEPYTTYWSWYIRYDDGWTFHLGFPDDDNDKLWSLDDGTDQPYAGAITTNVTQGFFTGYKTVYDGGGTRMTGNSYWGGSVAGYLGRWVKVEIEVRHDETSSGYIKWWEDGVLIVDYSGRTRLASDPAGMTDGIGGYHRNYQQNVTSATNWKYFDDVYFDQSTGGAIPRALLCQNSSYSTRGICEPQIPTSWASGAIGVTVNAGRFTDGSTAYLYVCDSDGSCNSSGTAIVIAAGGESPAALAGSPAAVTTAIGQITTAIRPVGGSAASVSVVGTLNNPSSAQLHGTVSANSIVGGSVYIPLSAPATFERRAR